ncbi:hypothetical protein H2204_006308 [Knufia peltigerae]|uniref:FAD-binding PCMH-type domain-containing protein n=1 Tax=Knufia peltigerae TaxID=1002370 RepID=A0AA39CWV0_9EURO|nr:hypothetical protein H2204_006308 [Knufia peltigerae]
MRAVSISLLLPSLAVAASNASVGVMGTTGYPPCDALISAGLGDRVLLATSDAYETRVQSYWHANGRIHPYCFVEPYSAEEVSTAVKALASAGQGAGDWHIAVKSGGHHLPATNNIVDGVTIDLGMMNSSRYIADKGIAQVGPGAKWKNVYANLLKNGNVMVTGGRDGDVGVGGFLLGGGNSYYSGRNGFGSNAVVGYEVVLANGTIVEATVDQYPDLWKSLKGGLLNYGIVTRFDLQTMPAVDLAYGLNVLTYNYSSQVSDALVDFTNNMEQRPDDHMFILYTDETSSGDGSMMILPIYVNTKGDLNTTSFDEITKIPSVVSSWERMSLAAAANASQVAGGTKNVQRTLTLYNDAAILREATRLHTQLVATLDEKVGSENYSTQVVFQPLPAYLSTLGLRNGTMSNVLGLERIGSNAILWTAAVAITNGDDGALAVAGTELSALLTQLEKFTSPDGKPSTAEWVYSNYADMSQDPLTSYGPENVAFMKEMAAKYDPEGFWQKRVPGGFKLSRV